MLKKHILLVDDNPDDIDLALRAFKKIDIPCDIIVARDGVEALDYLMLEQPLPDIILLDLKLPRLNGLEVLQKIRAHPRTALLPVIMLTSSNESSDLTESYRYGANSYIKKPIDFTEFIAMIHQLGTYWLILNEIPES